MSEKRTVLPTKFATPQQDEANLPRTEVHDYNSSMPLDNTPGRMDKPAVEGAHISEKVYLFPESFNALRIELYDNWREVFAIVGGPMAFDAPRFVELMDAFCDLKTNFDTARVEAICHRYLNALRAKRGLSPLSPPQGAVDMPVKDKSPIILPGEF